MVSVRLAVCEKALAEYLETKRLAFPRFYFVSSADLLDILSNGTEPVEVRAVCGARGPVLWLLRACSSSFKMFLMLWGRTASLALPGAPCGANAPTPARTRSLTAATVPDCCHCPQVSRHLSKLFDSLAKLKFKTGADKKPLKVALGMFSGDEEYVPFDADCDLSGQVSRARTGAGSDGEEPCACCALTA